MAEPTKADVTQAQLCVDNLNDIDALSDDGYQDLVMAVAALRATHRHAIADTFGKLPFPGVDKGAAYIRTLDGD